MIIDFTEIPMANKGGGKQDLFEQFSCDFLETIGFKILRRPDRGADGKKDMIVSENRKGVEGETIIKWLVSCKHFAHTGTSVKDTDELDIYDRVINHKCDGFMGIYSTIPGSTLSNKLSGLESKIQTTIYDSTRIEKCVMSSNQKDRLLSSYFSKSYTKYRKQIPLEDIQDKQHIETQLTEEDVLRITKTALISLEIEKIKEEYFDTDWHNRENPLNKLYRFSDHSNGIVSGVIFDFLQSVANQTRSKMPSDIAMAINGLIMNFFSSSFEETEKELIKNGKKCIYIGYGLVYDSFIYLNNFKIASYGLSIIKFIYREGKQNKISELTESVLHQYEELERTLNRPERNDLNYAKELVKVFKDDLDTWDLGFPILPDHLYKLVEKEK
jgi:hypothetical protein